MSNYISQPTNIDVNLFNHQLNSIYEMELLEKNKEIKESEFFTRKTTLGINADPTGFGKCFKKNTPILLFNGEIKKVQDIKTGDILFGDDSTPRKVLSLASGVEKMYRIHQRNFGFNDYIVNESHILSLKIKYTKRFFCDIDKCIIEYFDRKDLNYKQMIFDYNNISDEDLDNTQIHIYQIYNSLQIDNKLDIELKEYLKLPRKIKKKLRGYKNILEFEEQEIEIEPYVAGLFIGCGLIVTDGIMISNINTKVISYLINIFGEDKIRIEETSVLILDENNHLKEHLCLFKNSIPSKFIHNTINIRMKILAGIIDSCGICNNNNYLIYLNNLEITKQVLFLSRSLGFNSEMNKLINSHNNYVNYSIQILKVNSIPVLTYNVDYRNLKNKLHSRIKVIEEGEDNYYGFVIDGNRRFLLEDLTVVHNTLSMVSLITRDKMEWDIEKPYVYRKTISRSRGLVEDITLKKLQKYPTTLVLASQSIINQWKTEFEHSPLKVVIISNKKLIDIIEPKHYDVVIVTPTMYNNLVLSHRNYIWKRFIFDEPGQTRVPNMKLVYAGFYWFVTATPSEILYKYRNCRNNFITDIIIDMCPSGWNIESSFNRIMIKNDIEFVKESFNMPPIYNNYYKCHLPILNTLNNFVSKNINIMIQAGNIQGVINSLGGKQTCNIVELVKKKKLEEKEEIESKLRIYKIRNNESKIIKWNSKLERINKQVSELDTKFKNMLSQNCHICFLELNTPVLEYKCQNLFCAKCLLRWLENNNNCPLCRQEICTSELIYITKEEDGKEESKSDTYTDFSKSDMRIKTKIETVVDIIMSKEGKFLIFSEYNDTFKPICDTLTEYGISFSEVKGTYEMRIKNINRFKYEDLNVIFLNSNFNGAGLNLQEATDIILYHDMSENKKIQIIGRANRIGRKKPLYIHNLQVDI